MKRVQTFDYNTKTMNINEIIKSRHSVRSYNDRKIDSEIKQQLEECITQCNAESRLHIQLVTDEPDTFGKSKMAHYGKFHNVRNYVCLVGKKADDTDTLLGYYGEIIVLKAQELGLNTCWVGLSFSKGKAKCKIAEGENLEAVIAIGYGETQGITHKMKTPQQICKEIDSTPAWFQKGVEYALLAPTAINQQKFHFDYLPANKVAARTNWGFFAKMDLGIAKLHFELGAGKENFEWV